MNVSNLHTATVRKALNEAGSSRSIFELSDDAKVLVTTDLVLALYLVHFCAFFKNTKSLQYKEVRRYGPLLQMGLSPLCYFGSIEFALCTPK